MKVWLLELELLNLLPFFELAAPVVEDHLHHVIANDVSFLAAADGRWSDMGRRIPHVR